MPSSNDGANAAHKETNGFYGIMARAIVQGTKSVMSSMAGLETKPGPPSSSGRTRRTVISSAS